VLPPDSPATRTRLIEAAAALLWERSYAAAGVDDLCRRANARKGSFYHFFRTKADLAAVAIEFQWTTTKHEVFLPIAEAGSPGLDRLARLVQRTDEVQRRLLAEKGILLGCPFANLGQELAHRDERIRSAVQTVFASHCQFLRSWLDEAARSRQIGPGDNEARARQVFALFEGALLVAKVAANPAVFVEICAGLPAIAGRGPSVAPRSAAIPELL
jgi:TetR/AcrR family transcriptional repressor of nem operon